MHKSFQTDHALGFLSTGDTVERAGSTNNCWAETILGNKSNVGENIKSFKNSLSND